MQDKVSTNIEANESVKVLSDAHSDFETVLNDQKFFDWVNGHNPMVLAAYKDVYENGTAEQVVELLDIYKDSDSFVPTSENPVEKTKKEDKVDVARKIKDAEDKSAAPNSLSDVPDSTQHRSEAESLAESSPMALLDQMDGKSQEELEAMLAKVL